MKEMPCPLVCVCVPVFNAEATIRRCLESLLKQTYSNYKIVLVDNNSTDSTVEIINEFSDSRISLVVNETNIGAARNFERCIEVSDGEYTGYFHADEIFHENMIEKQVDALVNDKNAGVVFTEAFLIDESDKVFGETNISKYLSEPNGSRRSYDFKELFPFIVKHGNFLLCSGALVRTDILKNEIRIWNDADFKTSSDLDVWLRILERHKISLIFEKLMSTRTSKIQASYLEIKRNTARADMFLVLDHYIGKYAKERFIPESVLADYKRLELMDLLRRSMNLFAGLEFSASKTLLEKVAFSDFSFGFLHTRRGVKSFCLYLYLKLFSIGFLRRIGANVISRYLSYTGK